MPHGALPPGGDPGGWLVAALGIAAIASWLAAVVALLVRRQRQEAAWGSSLLVLAGVAGLLGAGHPGWHVILIGATAGIALRNVTLSRGAARWLTAAGLLAWVAAIARARLLFAGHPVGS